MVEEWRPAPGFEGEYEVSNLGRVRSLDRVRGHRFGTAVKRGRIMAQQILRQGYPSVCLCVFNRYTRVTVHRLVALAFIPRVEGAPEVNHIDGDKLNSCATNLEWVTSTRNHTHAVELGLNKQAQKVIGYPLALGAPRLFPSLAEAAFILTGKRGNASNIWRCLNGKAHSAFGHRWERA